MIVFGKPRLIAGDMLVTILGVSDEHIDILFSHEFVKGLKERPQALGGWVLWLSQTAVEIYGVYRLIALLEEELLTDSVELDDRWYDALEAALGDRQ